ncbi:MAG: hypothetical protein JW927_04825 [Deltaproteobacteria bacterium]|nr:hypothetical protein [Deltaproteobacteria bacterium]
MKKISLIISLLIVLIFIPSISSAVPPQPARIGGAVTVNGRLLTQSSDSRLVIKVTKLNGTVLVPAAEDTDGLSANGFYIIDIPIYDATDQPGGVTPGTTVVIHVYMGTKELTLLSPVSGQITVGASGSTPTVVNISAEGAIGSVAPILNLLLD